MEQNEQRSLFTLIKDRILPGFRLSPQERLSEREQVVSASIRQIQIPFLELLQE